MHLTDTSPELHGIILHKHYHGGLAELNYRAPPLQLSAAQPVHQQASSKTVISMMSLAANPSPHTPHIRQSLKREVMLRDTGSSFCAILVQNIGSIVFAVWDMRR
jgi:hypothetical protein